MKYVASFDIGSTAVKGVLVGEDAKVCFSQSLPVSTSIEGDSVEQDPEEWYRAFASISGEFFAGGFKPEDIVGLIFNGHMQNVIPVDSQFRAVRPALLYSDMRAVAEAEEIAAKLDARKMRQVTGNGLDAMSPLAKLLWFRRNCPEEYGDAAYVLGSAKDFVIGRITGNAVADMTAATTSGLMDIRLKRWREDWCDALGLDAASLPGLHYADECVGVTREEPGMWFRAGTPVYCGAGDAGATVFAGHVEEPGDFNINIGTTGWVATLSGDVSAQETVYNLCAVQRGKYVNVVPFLNAGNVHKWIAGILCPAEGGGADYERLDDLLEISEAGSNGLLFLPYLMGERFPALDEKIRGGYYGVTPFTTSADMARACLEAVAFSLRQGLEVLTDCPPRKVTLIGGGGRRKVWRQILADVLAHEIEVFSDTEYLPAIALSGLVFGEDFRVKMAQRPDVVRVAPNEENTELYQKLYPKYKQLYGAFKPLSMME